MLTLDVRVKSSTLINKRRQLRMCLLELKYVKI